MRRSWFSLGFTVLVVATDTTAIAGFTLETVDQQQAGRDNTLAVDSAQRPHICYRWFNNAAPLVNELRHAWRDVGGWTLETVLSQSGLYSPAAHPKLWIDANDQLHLVYVGRDSNGNQLGLKYAYRDAGGWHHESIGSDLTVNDPSIAIDPDGDILVAYHETANDDLKFARRTQGQWTVETVDAVGDVGGYASLALDAGGNPCITYFDYPGYRIKYAGKSGGTWLIEVAVIDINLNGCSSLEVDDADVPHFSYSSAGTSAVAYAEKSEGVWTSEVVQPALHDYGSETVLEFDGLGRPHIVYFDITDQDVLHTVRVGDTWVVSTVATQDNSGASHDFDLDGNDVARISYQMYSQKGTQSLHLATGDVVAGTSGPPSSSLPVLRIHPNPARGSTAIEWTLPDEDVPVLSILDPAGRSIRELAGSGSSGRPAIRWDGRDAHGASVPPGVYYVRLRSTGAVETKPIVWLD